MWCLKHDTHSINVIIIIKINKATKTVRRIEGYANGTRSQNFPLVILKKMNANIDG